MPVANAPPLSFSGWSPTNQHSYGSCAAIAKMRVSGFLTPARSELSSDRTTCPIPRASTQCVFCALRRWKRCRLQSALHNDAMQDGSGFHLELKPSFLSLFLKEMVWTPPTLRISAEAFGELRTEKNTGGASQSTASSAKVVLCIATP